LTLDFAPTPDKDWPMMWRRGVSVFVGVLGVSVMVGGCSRKEVGVANTAPIREETTTVAAPVVTDVPTTAVPTTFPSTSVSTDPQPVGDDYRGEVIVKAVPKTELEREILDATADLLAKRRRLALLNTNDRAILGELMVGNALEEYLELGKDITGNTVSVPSVSDRTLVTEVVRTSPDSGVVRVCEVDGAATHSEASGVYSLINKEATLTKWTV
jgi:hypothetical protein